MTAGEKNLAMQLFASERHETPADPIGPAKGILTGAVIGIVFVFGALLAVGL